MRASTERALKVAGLVLTVHAPCVAAQLPGPPLTATNAVTSFISGTSPTLVLGLDNNLSICIAAREWTSLARLDTLHLGMSGSQRLVFNMFALLERNPAGEVRCRLPILSADQMDTVRQVAGEAATRIAEDHAQLVRDVVDASRLDGAGEQAYAIVASYVLDGLVWEQLAARGLMGPTDAMRHPTGSPLWTGYAWISLRSRPSFAGTNRHHGNGGEVYVAWTPATEPALAKLATPVMDSILRSALEKREPTGDTRIILGKAGLVDDRPFRIPVIGPDSPTAIAARRLALSVGSGIERFLDYQRLSKALSLTDTTMLTLIAYHELYPTILSTLVSRNTLDRPLYFTTGAPLSEARRAVFVVRQ